MDEGAAAWAFSGGDAGAAVPSRPTGTGLRGRILGGALGLKLLGVEYAIVSVVAFGQSLALSLNVSGGASVPE